MRHIVFCILATTSALAACGGDPSAGTPYSRSPATNACTTGTQVVLFDPVPNTFDVSAKKTKIIEIASSNGISSSQDALQVTSVAADGSVKTSPAHQLLGPVPPPTPSPSQKAIASALTPTPLSTATPTPSPSPSASPTPSPAPSVSPTPTPTAPVPFPSPVFYAARGFRLQPARTYTVEVTVLGSGCAASVIPGATFKTEPGPT
jgi:hypothetical protein